jgi:hypothetical protein
MSVVCCGVSSVSWACLFDLTVRVSLAESTYTIGLQSVLLSSFVVCGVGCVVCVCGWWCVYVV